MRKYICCILILACTINSYGQRVVLDPSFGDSGVVDCKVNSCVYKIVSLPDGKILCLGAYADNLGVYKPALFKFDRTGKLDSTFSKDGILQDTIEKNFFPTDHFMNVQPDGRIYKASRQSNFTYISCYDTNGNPSLTFGKSGVLKLDTIENVYQGNLRSFTSCPDNKIIACWEGFYTKGGSSFGNILAKFDSTGYIDRSFGTDGFLVFKNLNMKFHANAITVFKDGSIVCAGSDLNEVHDFKINERTAIFKLNSDGTFNNNFSIGGKVIIDVDSNYIPNIDFGQSCLETIQNIIELDDNSMIVTTITDKNNGDYIMRLMPDGSLDKAFGNKGFSEGLTNITDIAVLNDGSSFTCNLDHFNFSPNGIADSSMTPDYHLFNEIHCISIQDNDKILLGGSSFTSGLSKYSIARFKIGPPLSVPEINARTKDVSIFPAPFKDVITFRSENSVIQKITIYDLNGRCVLSKSVADKSCTLNTILVKGVYLCKIVTTKGVENHKLMSTGVED